MSSHRGSYSAPWLTFGADTDTGISIIDSDYTVLFIVDAVSVTSSLWKTAVVMRGLLTALEAQLAVEFALKIWQPHSGAHDAAG